MDRAVGEEPAHEGAFGRQHVRVLLRLLGGEILGGERGTGEGFMSRRKAGGVGGWCEFAGLGKNGGRVRF